MSTEPSDLPDDVDALRALILAERAERQSESALATIAVARRDAELAARRIEIDHLNAMLAKLRRGKYGSSSEKLDRRDPSTRTVGRRRRNQSCGRRSQSRQRR